MMLIGQFCQLYEVHDFDAFYVTTILSWKHMRYPSEKSETSMNILSFERLSFF